MGGHHGIDHVTKMQYMMGCLDEQKKGIEGPNESRRKSRPDSSVEIPQLTRSKTSPYNKNVWFFFCDGPPGYRKNLHNISTFSAGESLRTAIGMSANDKFSVKLNTSIAPDDAHAIDIKYHKNCSATHVSHVLRRETSKPPSEKLAGEIAAQIEFPDNDGDDFEEWKSGEYVRITICF